MKEASMTYRKLAMLTCVIAIGLCASAVFSPIPASAASPGYTNLTVLVTDADTGQPIGQARLTLQFREPGDKWKLKRSKLISYSAKTNAQGRYRFTDIPEGSVRLIVTDEQHQTYGKDVAISKAHAIIDVKLKKPHPLL